ncbi:ty3-gypsy retrotransposon protein [Cucumis melo var. makuwa]|uniref:Ty3-gypsy retrotransposon protein n=1 Tax=Cucumis melo var. makuwa TaxID=1194695 RepID=A0A5A7UID4_CUCMM|nr:ty3-gypsy retrotransposon protein [Cucumis melo var. makuwa]
MIDHHLPSWDEVLASLKSHLRQAQEQMKKFLDVHRHDVVFDIGDWVCLKIQLYRQRSLAKKRCEKWPPVFHVSQLKKAVGEKHWIQTEISMLNDQMEWMLEPKKVDQMRWSEAKGHY